LRKRNPDQTAHTASPSQIAMTTPARTAMLFERVIMRVEH
jgi:hypothetical protein